MRFPVLGVSAQVIMFRVCSMARLGRCTGSRKCEKILFFSKFTKSYEMIGNGEISAQECVLGLVSAFCCVYGCQWGPSRWSRMVQGGWFGSPKLSKFTKSHETMGNGPKRVCCRNLTCKQANWPNFYHREVGLLIRDCFARACFLSRVATS